MTSELERKVVVLGSQGVGKTSIITRYVEKTFSGTVSSTIGASFFTHKMMMDNVRVKLQIWDTAGQERFRSMAPMYYRGAAAALLVYDITRADTFADIEGWIQELRASTGENMVIALLGNKTDIRGQGSVTRENGEGYAAQIGAQFYETSAKDNTGVTEAFFEIGKELLRRNRAEGTVHVGGPHGMTVKHASMGADSGESKPCCG
eukprot:gene16894-30829_t